MHIDTLGAIVTGGASGLGAATARRLAAAGARVTLLDRDPERGEALASEIGGRFRTADVTDADALAMAFDDAAAAQGPTRILVNCAGIVAGQKTTSRGEPHALDVFRQVVDVNLVGTFNAIRLAATRMAALEPVDGDRGVIVNTASVAAFDGQIGQAAYAASKGGVVAMTLPIARDLARDAVRVVTLAPGIFDTPMMASLPDDVRASLGASVPHPARLGDPDEFARLAVHVIENGYLNGEVIRLDGAIRMAPR